MKPENLSESAIRNWVGDRSFSRGTNYFRQQAIFNARQVENVLKASCHGSAPYPYLLWAELDKTGIVTAECSCPVGGGGHCKHVAALLLTRLHQPDTFRESLPLEAALNAREKEDLILLIRQMVARYPDLEELVDVVPLRPTDAETPVHVEGLVRQARQALRRFDYGHDHYDAAASIAHKLTAILQLADPYLERGQWQAAAQITCAILDELVQQFTEIYDHDGDLTTVLWQAGDALAPCLEHLKREDERRPLLRTLVSIVSLDIEVGGYGFGDDASDLLLEMTTAGEKNELAAEIETRLAAAGDADDFGSSWRRQSFGGWLLNLRAEAISDEEYIDICRRSALHVPMVDRLLALGRIDEAMTEAQSVSDYDLLSLADLFLKHERAEIAEQLVWERTARSNDTRLDGWLKDYALSREDWNQALTYAESQFWRHPSIERYQDVLSIAGKLGQEAAQYNKVVARLAGADRPQSGLLVRVHLHHGRIDEALATFSSIPPTGIISWGHDVPLDIELAQAAEDTHPREAIRLYKHRVE